MVHSKYLQLLEGVLVESGSREMKKYLERDMGSRERFLSESGDCHVCKLVGIIQCRGKN